MFGAKKAASLLLCLVLAAAQLALPTQPANATPALPPGSATPGQALQQLTPASTLPAITVGQSVAADGTVTVTFGASAADLAYMDALPQPVKDYAIISIYYDASIVVGSVTAADIIAGSPRAERAFSFNGSYEIRLSPALPADLADTQLDLAPGLSAAFTVALPASSYAAAISMSLTYAQIGELVGATAPAPILLEGFYLENLSAPALSEAFANGPAMNLAHPFLPASPSSDYLEISPARPYTATAKKVSSGFDDGIGCTYDVYVMLQVPQLSNLGLAADAYRVRISKTALELLSLPGEQLTFGQNIGEALNSPAFIGSHIQKQDAGGTVSYDPALLPPSLAAAFADQASILRPVLVSQYPDLADTVRFTWGASGLDASWADKLSLVAPSLGSEPGLSLVEDASINKYELVWNSSDGVTPLSQITSVPSSDTANPEPTYWTNTEQVLLQATGYEYFTAFTRDTSGLGASAVFAVSGIPFAQANSYYAKNIASQSAVRLPELRYDGQEPEFVGVEVAPPLVSAGSIWGYDGTAAGQPATLAVTYKDAALLLIGESVSNIADIEVYYDSQQLGAGSAGDFAVSALTEDASSGKFSVTVTLLPRDAPYDVAKFSFRAIDKAGNASAVLQLSDCIAASGTGTGAGTGTGGTGGSGGSGTAAAPTQLVVDDTAPQLTLAFDNNASENAIYYKEPRTATLTITEAHVQAMDPSTAIGRITGPNGQVAVIRLSDFSPSAGSASILVYQHTFANDGRYSLQTYSFTDFVGHSCAANFNEELVIDSASPALRVAFDNNDARAEGFFNAPRTATVTVSDDNFSPELVSVAITATDAFGAAHAAPAPSAWVSSGNTHEASVYFSDELHYTMSVTASDLAGNSAQAVQVPQFAIDLTKPTILIEALEDRRAYAGEVAPTVTFTDENIVEFSAKVEISTAAGEPFYRFASSQQLDGATKTISFADLAHVVENDNVYRFAATVSDKAGNSAETVWLFSVNRFGSTYIFSKETAALNGSYSSNPPDVVVTEINVSGLQEAESVARLAEGDVVRTLERGRDYSVSDGSQYTLWSEYTYTIPEGVFPDDAYYRMLFRSIDAAGNLSENTMDFKNADRTASAELAFARDSTAPRGQFLNVGEGEVYPDKAHEVQVSFSDNLALDRAVLFVDGKQAAVFVVEDNAVQGSGSFVLEESKDAQALSLSVYDKAGNVTHVSSVMLLITDDPVALWASTPDLMNGTIVAVVIIACAVALLIFLFWRRRRKNDKEAAKL